MTSATTTEAPAWRRFARQLATPDFTTTLLLLLPSIVLLLVVIAYPMIQGFWYSFTDGSLLKAGKFVGLENYSDMLQRKAFWHSVQFSLIFAFFNVVGCYLLGLGCALLLQMDFPGRGIFRVTLLLPWVVPSLVAVVSWRWMFNDDKALANQVIEFFGGDPVYFLSSSNWTIAIVIMIKIWRSFPFMMLSLLAALQTIDRTLYEAADIDGATRWQSFWHVTMPAISGVSVVLCLLMTIWTVNDYDTPWLLAQGGPANATENLIILAFRYTFARNDVGMGSAVSFMTLFFLMAIFIVVLRLQRRKV